MSQSRPTKASIERVDCDVLVLGSGAAGLAAALAARSQDLQVALLEKSGSIGGTTAMSGGVIWVPNNHHAAAAGVDDHPDAALEYLITSAADRADEQMAKRFLDVAPQAIRFLEESMGTEFSCLKTYPDYHPELPGGRAGGRSLDNPLFDTHELGAWREKLRQNPITGRAPMTIDEAMTWQVFSKPFGFPFKDVYARYKQGFVHGGAALVGRLLKACLKADVEPQLNARGVELIVEQGRVVGAVVEHHSARTEATGSADNGRNVVVKHYRATRGVILASGGFEWDEQLRRDFLIGVPTHPTSAPSCTGDGLRMAMSVGAELGNMSQAWWCPAVEIPEEAYDGAAMYRSEFSVRCLPHSIIVNQRGLRFTSEAGNYNDVTKPFFDHDSQAYGDRNLPAWLIVDQQYRDKYVLITAVPGKPTPDYITEAQSLAELAEATGIDPAGLAHTAKRFNEFAKQGKDRDFARGESAFDKFYGDPSHGPNPNLGTLAKAPYYAVRIHPGTIGTKGGPKVDGHGRVRRSVSASQHDVVPGLYAAGNAMAGLTGPGYPGAGVTIAIALTWGYLAGQHCAGVVT